MRAQQTAPWLGLPPKFRARFSQATPDSLAGLVAWGEGSDLGADGTAISSWLNKTLSGLDPAQATVGNRPTVAAGAVNGNKAAKFTAASSQYLLFPAGSLGWFNAKAGATILLVAQPISLPASSQLIDAAVHASAVARVAVSQTTATPQAVTRSDDATVQSLNGVTSAAIGVPWILGTISSPATGSQSSITSAGVTSGAIAPVQSFPATDSSAISIGARADGTTFSDMYIAAYAMYNVAYSRLQLAAVLNRWSALYGIRLAG